MIKKTPTNNYYMIGTWDIIVSFVCNGSHGNAVQGGSNFRSVNRNLMPLSPIK